MSSIASAEQRRVPLQIATLELKDRIGGKDILCITKAPLVRVLCNLGFIWVTQVGDDKDYVLHPGQFIECRRNDMVLVTGLYKFAVCKVKNLATRPWIVSREAGGYLIQYPQA